MPRPTRLMKVIKRTLIAVDRNRARRAKLTLDQADLPMSTGTLPRGE